VKNKPLSGQEVVGDIYRRLKCERNGWDLGLPSSVLVGNLEVTSAAFIERNNGKWLLIYAGAKGSASDTVSEILAFAVDDEPVFQMISELRSGNPDTHSLIRVLDDGRIAFSSKSQLGIEMAKACSRLGGFSVEGKKGHYQPTIVDFLITKAKVVLGQSH